jgi:hypothetical protein
MRRIWEDYVVIASLRIVQVDPGVDCSDLPRGKIVEID